MATQDTTLETTTASPASAAGHWRPFKIAERGSSVSREILAGLTTFAAMSYIVVVNPTIMAAAGMDKNALIMATAMAAIVATLLMAFTADLPVALAPGMGANAVFAFVVVGQLGVSWQAALAMLFVNGVLLVILSWSRWRGMIVDAFPDPIKLGIQCGIGLFIAYLGLKAGGLVVDNPSSLIGFGDLAQPATMLTYLGLVLTPALIALRVPGGILLSILLITVIGSFVPGPQPGTMVTTWPASIVAAPMMPWPTMLAFDFAQYLSSFLILLPIALYMFIGDFMSTTATLIGVTRRGGLMTADGGIPNARAAFTADSAGTMIGSMLGVAVVTSYVESVTGVEAGGRTGLTALTVAILFAVALFFWPLIAVIPPQATAPALVIVGVLMLEGVRAIDPGRPETSLPPLLTLIVTVCTFNLIAGMATGTFVYTLLLLALGRRGEISPVLLGLNAIFVVYFALTMRIF